MTPRDPFRDPKQLVERLYSYVAYAIGPGAEAEDVTADAVERALRYKASYDPDKGTPIAWLIGIARRCLAGRGARPESLDSDALDAAGDGHEGDVTLQVIVRSAVATLSPKDRELVALRYGADLTAREIGALTGRTTNAVEVALHRLHGRLREILDGEFGQPRTPETPPSAPNVESVRARTDAS